MYKFFLFVVFVMVSFSSLASKTSMSYFDFYSLYSEGIKQYAVETKFELLTDKQLKELPHKAEDTTKKYEMSLNDVFTLFIYEDEKSGELDSINITLFGENSQDLRIDEYNMQMFGAILAHVLETPNSKWPSTDKLNMSLYPELKNKLLNSADKRENAHIKYGSFQYNLAIKNQTLMLSVKLLD